MIALAISQSLSLTHARARALAFARSLSLPNHSPFSLARSLSLLRALSQILVVIPGAFARALTVEDSDRTTRSGTPLPWLALPVPRRCSCLNFGLQYFFEGAKACEKVGVHWVQYSGAYGGEGAGLSGRFCVFKCVCVCLCCACACMCHTLTQHTRTHIRTRTRAQTSTGDWCR